MSFLQGNILTPAGWVVGQIEIASRILSIDATPTDPATNALPYILPGFIDLHVHGGGGRDVMEGGDAIQTITTTHARYGTTSLLATTMTAPASDIERALSGIAEQMPVSGGAKVLGVHLEGPFISPAKLGAQPDYASSATLADVANYDAIAAIKVLTMAPELTGHLALIRQLADKGIRVQLGHSNASYEEALAALNEGASGFTHLFNAMTALHHRAPGQVGAALAHAQFAEIIPDLIHVHPGAILSALRAIPQLYAVTDATAATGMPDGDYQLGRQTVHKCLGAVRLADGTLAGSTLTMDQALRNLVSIGLPLAEASKRLSKNPAEYLGMADRGQLVLGAFSDLVVMNRSLAIEQVWIEGLRFL